ncbi:Crp/Fnr family transcriptional regulator [Labrys monachus]|uniref:CRP-like cAMP-binding protein n=1 Tax=Labrys monachus TaxID=217067 RepID=A0ABU0FNQ6_9HYPH|nr:Crp/Fnr family transcriptional regulator [Labrys monachus]MDQ0395729.1 CRP-like cAMP-binding protein [Labrys monachus]
MAKGKRSGAEGTGTPGRQRLGNQILNSLPAPAMEALSPAVEYADTRRGESLFEPGDEVTHACFPLGPTVIAFVLPMRDGRMVEAATIGREGAVGGVVSLGLKPAFARAAVRIAGPVARVPIARLEDAKRATPRVHDIFSRYADCLTAQVLQSVGCAALHPLEARCARWLLMTHDRLQEPVLPLTQESLAEMFGVARTYMTRIARLLEERGAISRRRGAMCIEARSVLEEISCECYGRVRRHFERVLPGLYPRAEP